MQSPARNLGLHLFVCHAERASDHGTMHVACCNVGLHVPYQAYQETRRRNLQMRIVLCPFKTTFCPRVRVPSHHLTHDRKRGQIRAPSGGFSCKRPLPSGVTGPFPGGQISAICSPDMPSERVGDDDDAVLTHPATRNMHSHRNERTKSQHIT